MDVVPLDGFVDVVHDFNIVPYPFADSTFSEIHAYHVLEHLKEPIIAMEELHRLLVPGGMLHIRVPHFSSMGAFTDMTHRRPFGYTSFDCFQKDHAQHYYTKAEFDIVHKEIKYFGLYPNNGVYEKYVHKNSCLFVLRPFVLAVNALICLSPTFFERFWCYWVGGAGEIVLTLKKSVSSAR